MRTAAVLLALVGLAAAAGPASAQSSTAFPWPGGARAAVVLTYDDGAVVNLGVSYALPEKYPALGHAARVEQPASILPQP